MERHAPRASLTSIARRHLRIRSASSVSAQPSASLETISAAFSPPGVLDAALFGASLERRSRDVDGGAVLAGDGCSAAQTAWAASWTADTELHESSWTLDKTAQLSADTVVLSWTARWLPLGLLPLHRAARRLGLRVSRVDIRDRYGQLSEFSWRRLALLLLQALRTGEVSLPEAAVSGRTSVRVLPDGSLAFEELLALGAEFRAGRVLNRRVAKDHADFLARWRRPPGVKLSAWDDAIRDSLRLESVPGMRFLDADGVSPESQRSGLEASAFVLTALTLATLAFGIGAARQHADQPRQPKARGREEEADEVAGMQMRSRRLLAAKQQQNAAAGAAIKQRDS